jgi:glucokinase
MLIGAIDIGGSKVAIGVVTECGEVVSRRMLQTRELGPHEIGLETIISALAECVRECDCELSGIGISCTGPVYPISGTIGRVANLPGWEGCEIVAKLGSRFKVRVAMENDADAAALAESRWGSGVDVERFLYVTLSTGIGAGLILHGSLYRGANGCHQEIGHHVVDPSGPLCYCGARGCWESMASGDAIAKWYLANAPSDIIQGQLFSAKTVFELSEAGDELAQNAGRRLSYYVGIGLANLTTILVPDVIALGGGLMKSAGLFLDGALELWKNTCGEVPLDHTSVLRAALREDLDLAGAAAVLLQTFNTRA